MNFIYACLICISRALASNMNLDSLRFIQSVFRHGDRTPSLLISTDVNNTESTWPRGLGALTTLGMQQEYELGKFLKQRYSGFLSTTYQKDEIFMISSRKDRTIMSAQCTLAGMFPPTGEEIWNPNLDWQPLPIHVLSPEDNYILNMNQKCPKLKELYDKVFESEENLKYEKENEEFLKFLTEKTGRGHLRLNDLWDIWDPLNCEAAHNDTHKWPDWVNETVFDKITDLFLLSTKFYYSTPEIRRLRGASLFYEIASRMKNKTMNGKLMDNLSKLKYFSYSAHDTTINALLQNIGVYEGINAAYGEIILFEMHELQGNFYIEIYKRNSTTDDLHNLTIPDCNPCSVDQFLAKAAANKPPKNWPEACGLYDPNSVATIPEEIFAILTVICLVLACLLATITILYCKLLKSVGNEQHHYVF